MKDNESIRLGSIISIRVAGNEHVAEVIGFVVGGKPKIRIRHLADDKIELRSDITTENTELITY